MDKPEPTLDELIAEAERALARIPPTLDELIAWYTDNAEAYAREAERQEESHQMAPGTSLHRITANRYSATAVYLSRYAEMVDGSDYTNWKQGETK